jgi:uncharacterized protein DUF3667
MVDARVDATCTNCGLSVTGRYCASCGEEVLDATKLTVRHFVQDSLLPEIVNLDGRVWRTLRYLLFRPAYLSLEYAAGRRRRYVKPLRVLLVAIIVYAFATQGGQTFTFSLQGARDFRFSLTPASIPRQRALDGTFFQIDRAGVLERMFTAKMGPVDQAGDEVTRRFNDMLGSFATPVSFTTVLLFAVALYALFRGRRPLFVEHAVFSMHCFSFVLLSSLLNVVVLKADLLDSIAAFAAIIMGVMIWQTAYLAIALRRFYWHHDRRRVVPWAQAAGVALLLYALNSAFLTGVQLLGGVIAIWRL